MRKLTRSLAAGLGVLIGTLVLSLALTEAGFRIFWPQENLYIYELRQDFLFHRAGFDGWTSTLPMLSWNQLQRYLQNQPPATEGPFKARLRFDDNGFLADETTPLAKKPGRKRVLVLGDSISIGWPEGFAGGYLGDLRKDFPSLDFVNCSLIGTNTVGLADIEEKYCGRFEADLVLLQITVTAARSIPDYFWADFMGPAARMEDAVWQKSAASIATLRRPPTHWRDLAVRIDLSDPRIRRQVETIYRPFLPLYDYLSVVRLIENSFYLRPLSHSPVVNEITDSLQNPVWEAEILKRLAQGDHPTLHAVERIKTAAARKNQQVLVVVVANRFGISSRRSEQADYARIIDGLKALKVDVVDLATEWRDVVVDDYYWKEDPHPNRNGYRAIADRLRGELARHLSLNGDR